ncbi:MAG: hypothetical protein K9J12_05270 [Melioribacteraceae bacterium]|nr:hypothetical protein [Melioribacteraceae bacterium]MCF8262986.1 hypothetical protein [Melioribacteraceae bacterium]MCF8430581.1 hypothetical protein [Melioribacteraceae bacterium]
MKFSKRFLHGSIFGASLFIILCTVSTFGCADSVNESKSPFANSSIKFWLSDPSQNLKFEERSTGVNTITISSAPTITIDAQITYQEMDGFGFALTGGSAMLINNMSPSARSNLLTELFDVSGNNIGTSYLRVSIGASDLDEKVFSYNDLPSGQTDVDLTQFTLEEDRNHLIPVLKEILAINPNLKIMGSPWSAPTWMKTNNNSVGGSLKTQYYDVYAQYFVRYIEEMAKEGITIDAITVQNEPLHPGNNPSMYMTANEQAVFIGGSLGPAFENAGISTKIICYDHNADRTDYPITVLSDPEANKYVDGSAFHLYGGTIDQLSTVHNTFPNKNIYFTEQWVGAPGDFPNDLKWHINTLIIGGARNWCKTVIEWNLAADENQDPHTPGGCTSCLGALTINGDQIVRNPAYFIIAHAAKFVRPGSKRIDSNEPTGLSNVAFKTKDNKTVLIVLNNGDSEQAFNISIGDQTVSSKLSAGAVGTYVFPY